MKMVGCTPRKPVAGSGGRKQGRRPVPHQDGAVAVMFVGGMAIIVAFCGLALDLSRAYNRKMEMQTVADTVALTAAYELDGTKAGVERAVDKASARFTASSYALTYQYETGRMDWSDGVLKFGKSPDGPWLSSGEAKDSPGGLLYAQVDTKLLDSSYSRVDTLFMPAISKRLMAVQADASAVAGRSSIAVTPLGICAMHPEARRDRGGELEEYGYRRGISYDLMQLNPDATDSGLTFLLDPFAAPGTTGGLPASDFNTVAPFVCTGTMAVARVTGGPVRVSSPFPLDTLYRQLNSRFESYTAPCTADTAPPDRNVMEYKYDGVGWMNPKPTMQAAALSTEGGKLWTVAGPQPSPEGTTAGQYGVLWSYAKAVKSTDYSAYEPKDWQSLYAPGKPGPATGYPNATPYAATTTASGTYKGPSGKGVAGRRVLNVALLSCPVSANSANVVGIGRFFMTVRADDRHLFAEFAGLADEESLRVHVKLYK